MIVSKKTLISALLLGLGLVCVVYLVSMGRADGLEGSRLMTEPAFLRPLFVGETGIKNFVSAQAILTSSISLKGGAGCPCFGIFKPVALVAMLTTWQFYANVFIFSTLFYILLVTKQYENSRHRPR